MKKLTILEINNYVYTLVGIKNNKYFLNLEFIDVKFKLSINDVIYIDDQLIRDDNFYTFGPIGSQYGKKITKEMMDDILILEKNSEKIYLQRYYG